MPMVFDHLNRGKREERCIEAIQYVGIEYLEDDVHDESNDEDVFHMTE